MKPFRPFILLAGIGAGFIGNAAEQSTAGTTCTANQPATADLQILQGTWVGVLVGDSLQKKITLTITGNSLHFHRDRNFWFEATITLPAGKDPKQLHATLTARPTSQPVDVGRVVRAFFKIEDRILTVATIADEAEDASLSFETAGTRYLLRKVQTAEDNGPTRDETEPVPSPKKFTHPPKPETDVFRFEKRSKQADKPKK